MMKGKVAKNISEYISFFPKEVQADLKKIRETIRKAAPNAEEHISYQMPAYKLEGMLVYFAAYEKHIGFYPGASGVLHFKKELAKYDTSKGTVKFPIGEKIPFALITKIVKARAKENMEKAKAKNPKKKSKI